MGDFTIQFGRLVAYFGKDTDVVIPGNVTIIGRRAFYNKPISSVVIPDSVVEIEQEAFMFAHLDRVELGRGVKKIGADAFLFNKDVIYSIYKQVPISVFAVSDRAHAAYHFLEGDNRKAYLPQVYEQNIAFLRKNLLKEISYKRLYADEIAKNPDLMAEVFQGAKLPQRTVDGLLEHYLSAGRPDMVALLLQIRNTGGANK